MTLWMIEPRDPLIVRNGRPFNASPGARAESLDFPYPATIAGGVRARIGEQQGLTWHNPADRPKIDALKQIGVRGPLLAMLSDDGLSADWQLPAPADALMVSPAKRTTRIIPLKPLDVPGAKTDLDGLLPIGPQHPPSHKLKVEGPRFWSWSQMQRWLVDPQFATIPSATLGLHEIVRDQRMHVSINNERSAAEEGALFQTQGLTFIHDARQHSERDTPAKFAETRRLALVVAVEHPEAQQLTRQLAPLGGERRLMRWAPFDVPLPACPDAVRDAILETRHCRVILATPGLFDDGWRPPSFGIAVTGIAASIGKPQVVSGWDLQNRHPKPTRRIVPAGSVYFLRIDEPDKAAIERWISAIWLRPLPAGEQAQHDGYGLALLGTWDGGTWTLEGGSHDEHA